MEFIADALLIAGATGAGAYCMVLSKRLRALKDLDSGLGAAIATLSRQVDEMRNSLESAKALTGDQNRSLSQLTARAEMAAGRLELLLAALHENGRKRPLNVAREDDEDVAPEAAPAPPARPAASESAVKPFAALRRAAAGDS